MKGDDYKFGDIFLYQASSHSGDTKIRPGVICSKDLINISSEVVQIVPFSTNLDVTKNQMSTRRIFPSSATGLENDSVAMCDKATVIKKTRVKGKRIGHLDKNHLGTLKTCLKGSHENSPVLIMGAFGA